MIPQRISIRGFLSYRDEQELTFDSASLWMLAGVNGSGKSAVFDAITYALFGGHRGGLAGASALINKNANSLTVEFDFLLDGRLYQARRTLKVNLKGIPSGTQQIRRWEVPAQATDPGRWEAVPDTSSKAGFDAWVRDHIGLTYETFTSSVLLMQGRAEKLLSAAPKDRFEVLASIVDLGRYQKLHKKADERRRSAEARLEALDHQLGGLDEVSEEELAAADGRVRATQAALGEAQARVASLERLGLQAERWANLEAKLRAIAQQWERAQGLLAEAAAIERDAERLRELQAVLPHLEAAAEQQQRLEESERTVAALMDERQLLADRLLELDDALQQTRRKRENQDQERAADEERRQAIAEQVQALAPALVLLRQLHRERARLAEARRQAQAAAEQGRAAAGLLARREGELADRTRERDAAVAARREAERCLTEKRTLDEEARKRRQRFYSVVGEKICRYCGQALTPSHVEVEKAKLEQEVTAAAREHRAGREAQEKAAGEEERQQAVWRQAERAAQEARDEAGACRQRQETALREAQRSAQESAVAYQELAEPYRSRVSSQPPEDWLATVFPTEADLAGLHEQRLALEREAAALQQRRDARLQAAARVHEEWTRLINEREAVQGKRGDRERRLGEEQVRQRACRERLGQAREALPAAWQASLAERLAVEQLAGWRDEKQALVARGAEARAQELRQACAGLESLRLRREELEREREGVPAEARREPALLDEELAGARHEQETREQERLAAQQARERLRHRREQRQRLQEDYRKVDRQHALAASLAELLGRNCLQLHLVRQAERCIVEYANAVLDRLSAGQLYLRLQPGEEGGAAEQALQLQAYNPAAGPTPFNVAFLSGSQRFRVAVSLALGIGQYASRRHRPIESVIIDEGFGCLDRQGRQVMIQELHNLKDHLRCILLVSHQEEFADAFPDGYRFEIVNGATQATRFEP